MRWLVCLLWLGIWGWAQPLSILWLADFNGPYGSLSYAPSVAKVLQQTTAVWRPSLVVLAGDVVAGQSQSLPPERFGQMWALFDREVAQPLSKAGIPYAWTPGNHDASRLPGYGREREAAKRYFEQKPLPLRFAESSQYPFAYSFVLNGVYFLLWDASSPRLPSLAWVETQLASVAAQTARLRMVVGHLGLFGVAAGSKGQEVLAQHHAIWELLQKHRVDWLVSAHQSVFYRSKLGRTELLLLGGVGGRDYRGYPNTARSVVSWLEIDPSGAVQEQAWLLPSLQALPLSTLPPFIDAVGGRLIRRDLLPP